MKRLIIGSLVAAALIAAAVMWVYEADVAYAYVSPGTPTGFVNDFARVLTPAAAAEIESELVAFNASTTNEIAVVTVTSMQGDYVENFATRLFAEWGIGKAKEDNGILILLAIEERKIRIEVGYGLEGALPDSVAQQIISDEMTPRLKAGDYDGAVKAAISSIQASVRGEYSALESSTYGSLGAYVTSALIALYMLLIWAAAILARSKSWWAGAVFGAVLGFFAGSDADVGIWYMLASIAAFTAIGALLDFVVSRAYNEAAASNASPPWWAGGGTSGGSSGGFGGFSGGSSGGGGASGSW